ncbi:MAG: hypothetical protein RSE54_09055, partial [Ruthenibacterium sp.]
ARGRAPDGAAPARRQRGHHRASAAQAVSAPPIVSAPPAVNAPPIVIAADCKRAAPTVAAAFHPPRKIRASLVAAILLW